MKKNHETRRKSVESKCCSSCSVLLLGLSVAMHSATPEPVPYKDSHELSSKAACLCESAGKIAQIHFSTQSSQIRQEHAAC